MKKQVNFAHNKWYLILFVIGYSIICGLQIYDYLGGVNNSVTFLLFPFWLMTMTQLGYPNRSRYQVWAFRYASLGMGVTWLVKIFATQGNPTLYLLCLPMLAMAFLPTALLDKFHKKQP